MGSRIKTECHDRLLASLTLIAGIGLLVMVPFALRGGAEFFMPVTAALVVAIALVPLLEWLERRGIPSKLAAGLCLLVFLMLAFFAIGSIVIPATDWVAQVPTKITKVRAALEPVIQLYKHLDRFIDRTLSQIVISSPPGAARVRRSGRRNTATGSTTTATALSMTARSARIPPWPIPLRSPAACTSTATRGMGSAAPTRCSGSGRPYPRRSAASIAARAVSDSAAATRRSTTR